MRVSTVSGRRGPQRVAAALTIAGTLLAGGVVSAQDASANTGGGGCRTSGWASETLGISERPCAYGDGGYGVYGQHGYRNPNGVNILPCAQLLRVNSNGSTTQVADYGCGSWTTSTNFTFNTGAIGTQDGTYVVQAGYWVANGGYVTGAQSARVTVYG
ncbi:hypothetical protein [Streptomyces sp. NBC_00454]|uniref:hypothetical protein n=1 Tax=Streptomyces sp. NBC_00454 TaxID=2975747 RepID=UPI0030E1B83B